MQSSQYLNVAFAACLAIVGCTPVPETATVPAPAPAPDSPRVPTLPVPATPPGHVHQSPQAHAPGALPPDAQFLHHMIPHHSQALVMTALAPSRASRPELRLVAERIAVSQRDEIAQMQAWLQARGHPVPAADTAPPAGAHGAGTSHDGHSMPSPHADMPGMLTPAELASLAAARGPTFDRLFLELMIRHHEGAITMVQQLFAGGGGQDSQIYAIASEVESDQRMEIARMRAILATLPSPAAAPR